MREELDVGKYVSILEVDSLKELSSDVLQDAVIKLLSGIEGEPDPKEQLNVIGCNAASFFGVNRAFFVSVDCESHRWKSEFVAERVSFDRIQELQNPHFSSRFYKYAAKLLKKGRCFYLKSSSLKAGLMDDYKILHDHLIEDVICASYDVGHRGFMIIVNPTENIGYGAIIRQYMTYAESAIYKLQVSEIIYRMTGKTTPVKRDTLYCWTMGGLRLARGGGDTRGTSLSRFRSSCYLAYLLTVPNRKAHISEIMENATDDELIDTIDYASIVRNQLHRFNGSMKKVLGDVRILYFKDDFLYLNPELFVTLDLEVIKGLMSMAERQEDMMMRLKLLEYLFFFYSGHFLPEYSDRKWAAIIENRYKDYFLKAVEMNNECLLAIGQEDKISDNMHRALIRYPHESILYVRSIGAEVKCGRMFAAKNILRLSADTLDQDEWYDFYDLLKEDDNFYTPEFEPIRTRAKKIYDARNG